jgi:lysozyme
MRQFILIFVLLSSFVFSVTIDSVAKKNINDTLSLLHDKDANVVNKLLTSSDAVYGEYTSENYKYIYKLKVGGGDRIGIFIIQEIYNENYPIIKKLNMEKGFVILINGRANKKVIFAENMNNNNQLTGIDVSSNNGYIYWELVKNDEISFAFIRATQGRPNNTDWKESQAYDNQFENNMNNAIKNHISVGAYHVVYPNLNKGNSGAIEEVNYFISKIKLYYQKNKLLPPVIDFERSSSYYSKQTLTNWIKTFAQEIEKQLGVKPILYMNHNYANKVYLNQLNYKLWISRYMYNADSGVVINNLDNIHSYNSNFKPYENYLFWQFTETANDIDGVGSSFIDKSIFNGNVNDLRKVLVQSDISKKEDPEITSVSHKRLKADTKGVYLKLYGKNLLKVKKIFIAGIADTDNFLYHSDTQIKIYVSNVGGYNKAKGVPLGDRDIIVKPKSGENIIFEDMIYVEESTLLTAYDLNFPSSGNRWSHTSGSSLHKITYYAENSFDDTYALDLNLNYPSSNLDRGKEVNPIANGKIIINNSYYGFILIKHTIPLKLDDGTILQHWYSGYMHMKNRISQTDITVTSKIGNISRVSATNDHLHLAIYTLKNGRYTSIDIKNKLSSFTIPITGWY